MSSTAKECIRKKVATEIIGSLENQAWTKTDWVRPGFVQQLLPNSPVRVTQLKKTD